jgi:hypothetical protein
MNYEHSNFPGKPVQQADARGTALKEGLRRLATKFGFVFQERLHINSRGEIDLFLFSGSFGEEFVKLLNKHNPRTGIYPTKFMDPSNSWCMMNHFDVARMLEEANV